DNLLIQLAAVIKDPVTTTDELIPSGETSSYRSNPLKLSEFAISRRVPDYVPRSKAVQGDGKFRELERVGTIGRGLGICHLPPRTRLCAALQGGYAAGEGK